MKVGVVGVLFGVVEYEKYCECGVDLFLLLMFFVVVDEFVELL